VIKRLAVFDCDGTLIDGQAEICAAMNRAFAEAGLAAPDSDLVRRSVGLSLPSAIASLLPDSTTALRRDVVEAYKQAFRAAREAGELAQPLFAGIADVLTALSDAGWELAVATGMSQRGLAHVLAVNGIADRFVSLQTADGHPSKPHPAMLLAALAEADAEPADAVMIGDTQYDILMGRDAEVRAIGVTWGYHEPAELIAAGAEYVAKSPRALQDYLLG
jgi:phosphoglycolate phosphatase